MTTITDPAGSRSVTYNREGTTISSISGNGTAQGSATPIVRYSQKSIVVALSSGSPTVNDAVMLPPDAEIGDVVEVYPDPASTAACRVWAPSGFLLSLPGGGGPLVLQGEGGGIFTYLGNSLWGAMVSA